MIIIFSAKKEKKKLIVIHGKITIIIKKKKIMNFVSYFFCRVSLDDTFIFLNSLFEWHKHRIIIDEHEFIIIKKYLKKSQLVYGFCSTHLLAACT